jgi:hypothetical protein
MSAKTVRLPFSTSMIRPSRSTTKRRSGLAGAEVRKIGRSKLPIDCGVSACALTQQSSTRSAAAIDAFAAARAKVVKLANPSPVNG